METSLVARLDEAIRAGSIDDLKPLWEYVNHVRPGCERI